MWRAAPARGRGRRQGWGWQRRGSALGEVALGDGEVPGELLVSVSRQEKEDGGEEATGREGAC